MGLHSFTLWDQALRGWSELHPGECPQLEGAGVPDRWKSADRKEANDLFRLASPRTTRPKVILHTKSFLLGMKCKYPVHILKQWLYTYIYIYIPCFTSFNPPYFWSQSLIFNVIDINCAIVIYSNYMTVVIYIGSAVWCSSWQFIKIFALPSHVRHSDINHLMIFSTSVEGRGALEIFGPLITALQALMQHISFNLSLVSEAQSALGPQGATRALLCTLSCCFSIFKGIMSTVDGVRTSSLHFYLLFSLCFVVRLIFIDLWPWTS